MPGGVVSASFEVSPNLLLLRLMCGTSALMRCSLACSWMVFWLSSFANLGGLEVPNNLGTGPAQIRLLVDASQAGEIHKWVEPR